MPKRHFIFIVAMVLIVCSALGVLAWRYILHPAPVVQLPNSVSSKLLFTPYLPHKLPDGLTLDPGTISTHEGALFFSVVNDTATITFSEQAVPKNYDLNTFYDSSIANSKRLDVKSGTAIYGDAYSNKGNIISYTTPDNSTWVILTSIGPVSKATAIELINSLRPKE